MNELEIIKHYQMILSCEQFVLTGSTALKYHGLVGSSSDIDIILVNPTKECISILEKLSEKSNRMNKDYPLSGYFFKHESIKIDVFIEKIPYDCCQYNGVLLSPADKIFKAKKKIGRLKDFAQLRKIASSIFTDRELIDYINSKA